MNAFVLCPSCQQRIVPIRKAKATPLGIGLGVAGTLFLLAGFAVNLLFLAAAGLAFILAGTIGRPRICPQCNAIIR